MQKNKLKLIVSTTCLSAAVSFSAGAAWANPEGGVVSGGAAAISSDGAKLNVVQTTDRAVIDWRSFDIATGEHTQFYQPSSSAIAVNRVGSGAPSMIMGTLSANGNIVIVNPNGVFFTGSSNVDVGGLIASSSNISNDAVMRGGRLNFDMPGNANAAIVNNGQITVKDAGLVGFVAPNVINNGAITAKLGKVHLASGDRATVDFYGDGLINVAVSDAVTQQLVSNTGIITADGGTIALTAAAGRDMVNSVVNVSGVLEARTVRNDRGTIIISAEGSNAVANNIAADKGKRSGSSTVIVHDALLDASGRNIGERGGDVTITGDNIALLTHTLIDASGYEGLSDTTVGGKISDRRTGAAGGDIRIGGDYLGQGMTPTAMNLYVDPGVLVLNDALHSGDAGRSIFWSDGTTKFYGNVYARALGGVVVDPVTWHATLSTGAQGKGGFVETSGHGHLDAGGHVDLTAASGQRGTYFLDPSDIAIYGNVDPAFISTDGSLNLASSLKLWNDANDVNAVVLTYDSVGGVTASGTSGSNTIVTGADISANLAVGARIRLGGAGAVTTAGTLGADTYTISAISGTTITLTTNLSANYAGSGVYRGLISQLTDKSGQGNNATQATTGNMPLWISNGQNGIGTGKYDGNDFFNLVSTLVATDFTASTVGNKEFSYSDFIPLGGPSSYQSLIYLGGGYNGQLFIASSGSYAFSSVIPPNNTVPYVINWNNNATNVSTSMNGINYGYGNNVSGPVQFNQISARGDNGYFTTGQTDEIAFWNSSLSTNARMLVDQYQSAKWGIALTPPGTGATEVAKATASDGYSLFTTRYLEHLADSADIVLQAANSITLDLKGDTLNFATGARQDRSFTLQTISGNIAAVSAGTIATKRTGSGGNITITAGGTGAVDIGSLDLVSNGGSVSITSPGAATLGNISAGTILARTTGAAADLTIAATKALSATDTGNALTLAAGRNFINNSDGNALSAASGRWLVYSGDPANNTRGGLMPDAADFNKTYVGNAPATIGTGNRFVYARATAPVLTYATDNASVVFGTPLSAGSITTTYTSGLVGGDLLVDLSLAGATGLSTTYVQGVTASSASPYVGMITATIGTLTSALGYTFNFTSADLTVTQGPAAPPTLISQVPSQVINNVTFLPTAATMQSFDYPSESLLSADSDSQPQMMTSSSSDKQPASNLLITITPELRALLDEGLI